MAGRSPRGVYQAFCLLVAAALITTLLAMASGLPATSPAANMTDGDAVAAETPAETVQQEAAWEPETSAPRETCCESGEAAEDRNGKRPTNQSNRGENGDGPTRPWVAPRAPRVCASGSPLAAAAAAGEALPYVAPGSAAAEPGALAELEQALRDYLATRPGQYGVAVLDLTTGATAAVGADQVFVAASTVKAPLAMYVFDLVAEGKASLDEPLTYDPADWEGGTGILQDSIPGDCYTVAELVDLAITVSDNIATNMLLRRFGFDNFRQYMLAQGGTVTNLPTGRRATTPRDMIVYLERAYRRAVEGDGLYRTLMGLMTQTVFSDRIAAGAPPGVTVAHKIGTLPGMVHDVGIVFLPGRPFAIALFSAGVDEAAAASDLAEITRVVSTYLAGGGLVEPVPPGGGAGGQALPAGGSGGGAAPSAGGSDEGAAPPAAGSGEGAAPLSGGSGEGPASPAGGAENGAASPAGTTGEGAASPAGSAGASTAPGRSGGESMPPGGGAGGEPTPPAGADRGSITPGGSEGEPEPPDGGAGGDSTPPAEADSGLITPGGSGGGPVPPGRGAGGVPTPPNGGAGGE